MKQNGWLSNGIDFPVENIELLNTFYSSVFRTDHKGHPEGGWQMEEGLTREQALRSMTIWASKASFDDTVKGSLESGKWVDFVILNTDLIITPPESILKTKIENTWLAGKKVN